MMRKMRIKAVLRDPKILKMQPGSNDRIQATLKKNLDRPVSLASLLKVMGMTFDERTSMLERLGNTSYHVWLLNAGDQDVVIVSESENPDMAEAGYKWQ